MDESRRCGERAKALQVPKGKDAVLLTATLRPCTSDQLLLNLMQVYSQGQASGWDALAMRNGKSVEGLI